MHSHAPKKLHFAGLTLDLARLSIEFEDREIFLRPKSFDVLRCLAENPGRLITKDELIKKVWSGTFVTDDSLVQCIREIREAIGDDRRNIIRTLPRRGYLFAAPVTESAHSAMSPEPISAIRYAKSGNVHIAYRVWGEGNVPLVFCPGFITHIEHYWSEPGIARFLRRMGQFARVLMLDKRGTGMSDRVEKLPSMDERVDDVRAAMDAIGVERAVVMGASEGGSLAAYFAATHAERCQALVLYGAFSRFTSWIPTEEALQQFLHYIDTSWGSGASLWRFAPSMVGNAAFEEWWGRFELLGASPAAAIALMRVNSQIDITDILPTINIPTLVIHRNGDVTVNIEAGRRLAASIPNARFVELTGIDHLPWVGDNSDEILRLIEEFILGHKSAPATDRVLATVLVMDILGTTACSEQVENQGPHDLMPAHNRIVRQELASFRGRQVRSPGSGIVATFDGPSWAIRGAFAIKSALGRRGTIVRIGIHIGEVEIVGDNVQGVALTIAEGVVHRADPGGVVVSRTVKDLVAGSNIAFQDLGMHALEGTPNTLQLYLATA